MKLYEIDRGIQEILDNMTVDPGTGEVVMDTEGLAALQLARDAKLESIALAVKNMSAEAEAIRNEEKALAERRRVLENKTGRMKEYLLYALGGEKLETSRVKVAQSAGRPSAVIDDPVAVSEWQFEKLTELGFMSKEYQDIAAALSIEEQPPKVSKTGVKKLMEKYQIPGAHIEEGAPSLRIS